MKVLIAIDSFKGSLSSLEAAQAIKSGILSADSDIEVDICPIADGGEGTLDAILGALGGEERIVRVKDPLGNEIEAKYGLVAEKRLAVMEMSAAAGLPLVPENRRDPMITTTYGVGQMITDALDMGARSFVIGIGGSATNDCGQGMLKALGFSLTDRNGNAISEGAAGLRCLENINTDTCDSRIKESVFRVACDVKNPLFGENGASYVFAPQKGADANSVREMDLLAQRFAEFTGKVIPSADPWLEGSGAAGGMGFAFKNYLGADLVSGIDLVMSTTGLYRRISDADIVITGEGRLDGQTAMGKAPIGVAQIAEKCKKTVIAIAGSVTRDAYRCNERGIHAFFPSVRGITTIEEAMDPQNAKNNLKDTAEQVFRLINRFYKSEE